jgi:hypothetical protein
MHESMILLPICLHGVDVALLVTGEILCRSIDLSMNQQINVNKHNKGNDI